MTTMSHLNTVMLKTGEKSTSYEIPTDVLLVRSDYFRSMSSSGMKDSNGNVLMLPALDDIGLEHVAIFLCNLGNDQSNFCVPNDCIQSVLQASTYLQIADLTNVCCENLRDQLTVSSCVFVHNIGITFGLTVVEKEAQTFMSRNFEAFSSEPDFCTINEDLLCALLGDDQTVVGSEVTCFRSALNWIFHQFSQSSKSKGDILSSTEKIYQYVRFGLLTPDQVKSCYVYVQQKSNVQTFVEVASKVNCILDETMKTVGSSCHIHCNALLGYKQSQVRSGKTFIIASGGFTPGEKSTNRMQFMRLDDLSLCNQELTRTENGNSVIFKGGKTGKCKLPQPLCEHCVSVVDNCLFVAGGQMQYSKVGKHTSSRVFRFDPRHGEWLEVASMQQGRSLFYMASYSGCLISVSGWVKPETVTRTVEKYIPYENRWIYLSSVDMGLHEHAGCVYQDAIYISGGFKGPSRGHLDKVWCYQIHNDSWKQLAPMSHSRSYHAMVPVGTSILVVGGVNYIGGDLFEDVKTCELYNVTDDQWTHLVPESPLSASCMPTMIHHSQLFLFGGHSFAEDTNHHKLQILDLKRWQWNEADLFSNNILCFACGILELPDTLIKHLGL